MGIEIKAQVTIDDPHIEPSILEDISRIEDVITDALIAAFDTPHVKATADVRD